MFFSPTSSGRWGDPILLDMPFLLVSLGEVSTVSNPHMPHEDYTYCHFAFKPYVLLTSPFIEFDQVHSLSRMELLVEAYKYNH